MRIIAEQDCVCPFICIKMKNISKNDYS